MKWEIYKVKEREGNKKDVLNLILTLNRTLRRSTTVRKAREASSTHHYHNHNLNKSP